MQWFEVEYGYYFTHETTGFFYSLMLRTCENTCIKHPVLLKK